MTAFDGARTTDDPGIQLARYEARRYSGGWWRVRDTATGAWHSPWVYPSWSAAHSEAGRLNYPPPPPEAAIDLQRPRRDPRPVRAMSWVQIVFWLALGIAVAVTIAVRA